MMKQDKKAILISIQPKWVEKILNGEKTIEIRKSMPKCELPIDVYIYCSKGTHRGKLNRWFDYCGYKPSPNEEGYICNGKIVAKFTLNKVSDVLKNYKRKSNGKTYVDYISNCGEINWCQKACLSPLELENYLSLKNGYAWHIENLQIFDKPMELNQFEKNYYEPEVLKPCCNGNSCKYEIDDWLEHYLKVTRPPQSWQYVYIGD